MAKKWLRDRWDILIPALAVLTVEQVQEIERICEEEKTYFRARFPDKLVSRKEPMTDTRNELKARFPESALNDGNSWLNPKEGKREHISLRYMNWSTEEWAEMDAPSTEKQEKRRENQQVLEDPHAIVALAAKLLVSVHWEEKACALAVVLGCRITEVLKTAVIRPATLYSVYFEGQLKRADAVLDVYEKPTLVEATLVLAAWASLRQELDCSTIDKDQVSSRYGPGVVAAARHHFASLVPAVEGKTDLYTHLLRDVYPCIAFYYYAPVEPERVGILSFYPTILGHYWVNDKGEQKLNTKASLNYMDYVIGDKAILASGGKRQGIMLDRPGVEVLKVYQKEQTDEPVKKGRDRKMETAQPNLQLEAKSKTGYSQLKPRDTTRALFYKYLEEEELMHISSKEDAGLVQLLNEHYEFKQLLSLGLASDFETLLALLKQVKDLLDLAPNLAALVSLLADAKTSDSDAVGYLAYCVDAKRVFKKSYDKRYEGKDYTTMSVEDLRKTRTTEASLERWRRGVNAIIAYNNEHNTPEGQQLKWFITPTVIKRLVGGKAEKIKEYLGTRKEEIDAHHAQHNVTPGYSKKPVSITSVINLGLAPDDGDTEGEE